MTKVLITGIAGFAGTHLAEYILKERTDWEVYGVVEPGTPLMPPFPLSSGASVKVNYARDVTSSLDMDLTIGGLKPNIIFHLAARPFVPDSFVNPEGTFRVNLLGTLNVLNSMRKYCPESRMHFAGSSEEYGLVEDHELPIWEGQPLRPLSPYGVSKVAASFLCYQYHKSYGLGITRTRAFNHTGPGRGHMYATSTFARQVVEVERGEREEITVGNLGAVRDLTDVRDMVRAYVLAVEFCPPGDVFNVCSGKGRTMRSVLDVLLESANVKVRNIQIDQEMLRPSDVPRLIGHCHAFRMQTGWSPEIPFDQTMRDLLDYWRDRLK
jgi:GDP-4-dehydro-6-deoxy-D-mannose reductase